jgi:NDP-sugar pyrophosphorylase family protein
MKAVVLVGGEGTRLRPLTLSTPKPLLPIANQAFLERQLGWLAGYGVDEVVLSMGYLPDAFHSQFAHDHAGEDVFGDIKVRYAVEDEPLGTAGAIRFAAEGMTERFIVCNGDVLTDLDLSEMVRFHDERDSQATISLTQVEDPSAFGVVPTRADGQVIAFVEKPAPGKAPSNWINAGTYVLEPAFLDRIPPRLNVSIERETFPRMLAEPRGLYGYAAAGYWLDIGTPAKYLQAHADVLGGRLAAAAPGASRRRGSGSRAGCTAGAREAPALGEGSRSRPALLGPTWMARRDVGAARASANSAADMLGLGSIASTSRIRCASGMLNRPAPAPTSSRRSSAQGSRCRLRLASPPGAFLPVHARKRAPARVAFPR